MKLWGVLLATFLLSSSAVAGAPTRMTVVLKEKMSCREVKKLIRIDRFFVQCNAKKSMARAWAAHYFGNEPVNDVIRELSAYAKVETASLGYAAGLSPAYAADLEG